MLEAHGRVAVAHASRAIDGWGFQELMFDAPIKQDILESTDPRAYLRAALAGKQFELYGQPLLALKDNGERGMVEVFVRMREEETALLPPGEFFPVFEALGMMGELDAWVVREALAEMAGRPQLGALCVNLSRATIENAKFPDFVRQELQSTGVAAARLIFEMTEADAKAGTAPARRFAESVRQIGARVVLEDFHCAQDSFDLLGIIPTDYLKLDGGIVRKCGSLEAARTAISWAVKAAASAGMRVVAEAVEDQRTLATVQELGVDLAQGFGVRPPVPLRSIS